MTTPEPPTTAPSADGKDTTNWVQLFIVAVFIALLSSLITYASVQGSQPAITTRGTCTDPGGLRIEASGFTPGGTYHQVVTDPFAQPYFNLLRNGDGPIDQYGQLSAWTWECAKGVVDGVNDPAGAYRLTIVDRSTGESATTLMVLTYPPPR